MLITAGLARTWQNAWSLFFFPFFNNRCYCSTSASCCIHLHQSSSPFYHLWCYHLSRYSTFTHHLLISLWDSMVQLLMHFSPIISTNQISWHDPRNQSLMPWDFRREYNAAYCRISWENRIISREQYWWYYKSWWEFNHCCTRTPGESNMNFMRISRKNPCFNFEQQVYF